MVTTQAPAARRGRATGQPEDPAPAGPLRLTALRQRGRLLGLRTGQIVTIEIAALAVVIATLAGPRWIVLAVGVPALIVVVLTLGRTGGRWWYEAYRVGRRLRKRRATRGADSHPDPRLAGLRELAPDLTVSSTEERGALVGIAHDAAGWFAAIEVAPADGIRVQARPAVPLDQLASLLDDTGVPLSAVQVVVHTVPAPMASLPPEAPALASYRLLVQGTPDGPLPGDEVTWISVRLDAGDASEAAHSRGGGVVGVHRALAAALGRVGQILTSAHIPYRLLDANGLIDALARSCGIGGRGLPAASGQPRTEEQRRSWRADGNAHISYWIEAWPAMSDQAPLLGRLARVSADAVTVSTVLSPARTGVDVRGVVRVTGEPSAVERSASALRAVGHDLKFTLRRQNGEQAPAVYASAPTGGGPRD